MRLREVFRFEIAYRLRRPSTWIYGGILLFLAFWISLANADGSDPAQANAPAGIAQIAVIIGMIGIVVTAALFGDAAVRDFEAGTDPLLFTTPLRKAEYLGGRFLAALAVNAALLLAIPLGQAAITLAPFLPPETFGPFRLVAYVQAYLFFLLPNVVLVGAVLFAIAALARKTVPVYLGAIGLFIAYLLAASLWDRVGSPALSMLGDPLGAGALENMTRYWTMAERNARLVGFPAMLVWNRVVWLAVAGGVLALLHNRFRFAHGDEAGRRRERRMITDPGPERAAGVAAPQVAGSFGSRTRARQVLAVARRSLEEVAGSRWFIGALVVATGLTVLMGWNVTETVFDTSTWPVTHLVAGTVLSQRIVPILYLLTILYAGELVWKERDTGVAEIADAAPVPGCISLAGRFLALVAMLAMFLAALMAGGLLIQAFQGWFRFEIGLYLRMLFGLDLADFVLLGALAMTIHVLVNHKYLGHIAALIAFLSTVILPQLGLVRHHLLLYGTDPGWRYSDMNGFGPFIGPFVWLKLYWAAWAALLGVLAVLFVVRGREPGMRRRLRAARARFTRPVARAAGAAALLILGLGGFIFYNTNILNDYHGADDAGAAQAEYEKRYARFEDAPQPVIARAALREEIRPEAPAVDLDGSYLLVNATDAPIDSVHVLTIPGIDVHSIGFDRGAAPVLEDDDIGYRIWALGTPLAPGDSLRLSFDVSYRPRGFPNADIQTDVVRNGAYFDRRWLPFIGYQPFFELPDGEARRRSGLPPKPPRPSPAEPGAGWRRSEVRDADRVAVDAVIGTDEGQIAITPGVLRDSATENGRSRFHYETEGPTSFGAAVFSARYAVLEDRWNGVALRIFHHPSHTFVLDRMVRSMKASLDYYTTRFGPYGNQQLRIVEIPPYRLTGGRAHPGTIAFSEDVFLSRVRDGQVDQPFFGTAHEIAHQWWGGQVSGAPVRGAAFLSESLANYSAMMVVEKTYGRAMARRVYDFQMSRYLLGRAGRSREVPLLEVEDQSYISYRKGAVALYTLRERIGEEAMNTALRRYLEKWRDAGPPYPTSLDLYAELRAVTPDSLRPLLTDLFETVTLWDVRARRAVVEPTGDGAYRVTLDVAARKLRADSIGNETEVPMDEMVEIGVYAPGEDTRNAEPLYLARHRIRTGEQTITVVVPREPERAGVDPRHGLIDRNVVDNVVGVERSSR